jgi:superfamily I DNA/RNA helicase/RecB family exonuclease
MSSSRSAFKPDASQQSVLVAARRGHVRVWGAAGSGKTSTVKALVVDVAARSGADSVRVLTSTRRTATLLRDGLALAVGAPTHGPLARSVSSFAHQVIVAAAGGAAHVKLIAGGQHDALLAELLAGEHVDGVDGYWPESLGYDVRSLREFRTQLRDLAARCADERITFAELAELGRYTDRPEWVASARFLASVPELLGASHANDLDPSELLIRAINVISGASTELHHAIFGPLTMLVIDDAHDLSPLQWRLIEACAARGITVVAFGNPDTATTSFRGGDSASFGRALSAEAVAEVSLESVYIGDDVMARLVAEFTGRIGQQGDPAVRKSPYRGVAVDIRHNVSSSAVRQYDAIARHLRVRHGAGVGFDEMAVVVRSGSQAEAIIAHLVSANIPAYAETTGRPLRDHPAVRDLLTIVGVGIGMAGFAVTADTVDALLRGPFTRFDSLTLRALRRRLRSDEITRVAARNEQRPEGAPRESARSAAALLVEALNNPEILESLPAHISRRAVNLATVLGELNRSRHLPIDELLWVVWDASGLSRLWLNRSRVPGALGVDANRSLDAVMALFQAAAASLDATPDESASVFITRMLDQQVPDDTLSPRATGGSVVVCTPAATVGRSFDTVVIAGLIDGVWPNMRPRGSLLSTHQLADAYRASRSDEPPFALDERSLVLHDELRLFVLSITRARSSLYFTSVAGEEENPSPLFTLSARYSTETLGTDHNHFTAPQLVAHLRRALSDDRTPISEREHAAAALKRLAESGIAGAHPDEWLGMLEPSSTDPVYSGEPVAVSPSKMKDVRKSAVDWFIDRIGGTEKHIAMSLGSIIHKAMEIATEPTVESMMAVIDEQWNELEFDAPWSGEREKAQATEVLSVIVKYLDDLRARGGRLAIPEAKFTLKIGGAQPDLGKPGAIEAQIHGFIDRVEIGADGAITITDLKTGKYDKKRVGSGNEIDQLSAYQLAYFCNKLDEELAKRVGERQHHLGGAQLFFPKSANKTSNPFGLFAQEALTAERAHEFAAEVLDVAQLMSATQFHGPLDVDSEDRGAATKRWVRIPEVCSD